ncbi:MAG: tRNA (adenosine(37)-N6)-dimethylallyltransferase MiaA [Thermogutta sp.]|nr:tRNA (adenosine(37)-N6)-dimethylallyltransferase MiaA [Thermogutta sp.]
MEVAGEVQIPLENCWFLTGPTASGKTELGVLLAERLEAEILSMDSMAVYRGMDIGTAKPDEAIRRRVPHHLLDLVDPWEEYSLARYLEDAATAVERVRRKGKPVLFVGGTPLYLKAALRGIFQGPPADAELRRRLRDEAAGRPPGFLHARLAKVDPQAAARLHPNDQRRIIRALEVYETTGRPISRLQAQFDRPRAEALGRVFQLHLPRELLRARIERRTEALFAQGFVEEVRRLLDHPRGLGPTASRALGYQEVIAFLRGQGSLEDTIAQVKLRTRQFTKRQMTWFRHLEEVEAIPVSPEDTPRSLEERILLKMGR